VLAWGNSVSDLLANRCLAREGHAKMAISGCYGEPIFNRFFGEQASEGSGGVLARTPPPPPPPPPHSQAAAPETAGRRCRRCQRAVIAAALACFDPVCSSLAVCRGYAGVSIAYFVITIQPGRPVSEWVNDDANVYVDAPLAVCFGFQWLALFITLFGCAAAAAAAAVAPPAEPLPIRTRRMHGAPSCGLSGVLSG
jgi:hypothetical protein